MFNAESNRLDKMICESPKIIHDFRSKQFRPDWRCTGWRKIDDMTGKVTGVALGLAVGDGFILEWQDKKMAVLFKIKFMTHANGDNMEQFDAVVEIVTQIRPNAVDTFLQLHKERR